MNVAYFVHDLNDPAVARRLRMLHMAGAQVTLLGFWRGDCPAHVEGITPVPLGRTEDGRFPQRMLAILRAFLHRRRWARAAAGADLVMARQVETLVLAAYARAYRGSAAGARTPGRDGQNIPGRDGQNIPGRHGQNTPSRGGQDNRNKNRPRLIYECLDIHRLTVSQGWPGRILRAAEGALLRRCQGLIVSSPDFVEAHFARAYPALPPVHLIENKVLEPELPETLHDPAVLRAAREAPRPAAPPWRIGWFGMIRCRRSLLILIAAAKALNGALEVIIRGRVAATAIPDFDALLAGAEHVQFLGAYDRSRDLGRIYTEVHFAWAIDYFEEGANSEWLLPNRLYESLLFGAVPLAREGCATARWLQARRAGIVLAGTGAETGPETLEQPLITLLRGLDPARYHTAREAVLALPLENILYRDTDCVAAIQAL